MRLFETKKALLSFGLVAFAAFPNCANALYSPANPNANFTDEVYAGYQGWFSTEGDGIINGWFHWAGDREGQKMPTFDLLPDTSIYPSSALTAAPFAGNFLLFSSKDEVVIETHFRLLAQTQIDGFAIQRFVNDLDQPESQGLVVRHKNQVLRTARKMAEKYKKKFYVTYDISGGGNNWAQKIKTDFEKTLISEMDLFSSPMYAKQNGRIVICLWGAGFTDRPGTAAETIELIRWLQQRAQAFVIGGVPTYWRTSEKDSKPGFKDAYLNFDSLQPWLVGRFKNDKGAIGLYESVVAGDLIETKKAGKHYQTVIWPGFSWTNLMKLHGRNSPLNEIPRAGGKFFFNQARLSAERGLTSYIAMFDEYDEGTAIAPAIADRSQIPQGTTFLSLDADNIKMSSDFYLRLGSEIASMLKTRKAKKNFSTPYMVPPQPFLKK